METPKQPQETIDDKKLELVQSEPVQNVTAEVSAEVKKEINPELLKVKELEESGQWEFTKDVHRFSPHNNQQYIFIPLLKTNESSKWRSSVNEIFEALQERNWRVDDIKVEFDEYTEGAASGEIAEAFRKGIGKYRLVRSIEGKDFRITFHRSKVTVDERTGEVVQNYFGPNWRDTAEVTKINIPKMEIDVDHCNFSNVYLYVGQNWEKDKFAFENKWKGNEKNKELKTHIKYSKHEHGGDKVVLLPDREYAPEGSEPKELDLYGNNGIWDQVGAYLQKEVLPQIQKAPIPEDVIDPFTPEEAIPFPSEKAGKIHMSKDNNYGLPFRDSLEKNVNKKLKNYPRWAISTPLMNEKAYKGCYQYGALPELCRDIWSRIHFDSSKHIPLKLKFANDVYVFDASKGKEYLEKATQDKDWEERAMKYDAQTLISITEYKGDFKSPVYLIFRELSEDEIGRQAVTDVMETPNSQDSGQQHNAVIQLGDLRVLDSQNPDLAEKLYQLIDNKDPRFSTEEFYKALKDARNGIFETLEEFLSAIPPHRTLARSLISEVEKDFHNSNYFHACSIVEEKLPIVLLEAKEVGVDVADFKAQLPQLQGKIFLEDIENTIKSYEPRVCSVSTVRDIYKKFRIAKKAGVDVDSVRDDRFLLFTMKVLKIEMDNAEERVKRNLSSCGNFVDELEKALQEAKEAGADVTDFEARFPELKRKIRLI